MVNLAPSVVKIQYSEDSIEAVGAGFFITLAGHLLTCQHVIDGIWDDEIWISWDNLSKPVKAEYHPEWSDSEDRKDFAVLKVSLLDRPDPLPPKLELGTSCEPDHTIIGIGYQNEEFDKFPAHGKVLGNQPFKRKENGCSYWILTGATHVDEGISGSPALNEKTGKIIGIFTEKRIKREEFQGVMDFPMDKIALVTPIQEVARELAQRKITDKTLSQFIDEILDSTVINKTLQSLGIDYSVSADYNVTIKLSHKPDTHWKNIWKSVWNSPKLYYPDKCSLIEIKGSCIRLNDSIERTEKHHIKEIEKAIEDVNERADISR